MDWRLRSMRRPAINEPGQAHELTFSCYASFRFLDSEWTCQWLADAIDACRKEQSFALLAYVFMPEHVHLLLYPLRPKYEIQTILKEIKEPVGRKAIQYMCKHAPEWLPRITVQCGKRQRRRFWQAGGGYDRNATELHTILAMIEYIHANPVRRGLVARPEDWKWSSAGWCEGKNTLRPDPFDFCGTVLVLDGWEQRRRGGPAGRG